MTAKNKVVIIIDHYSDSQCNKNKFEIIILSQISTNTNWDGGHLCGGYLPKTGLFWYLDAETVGLYNLIPTG